MNTELLISLYKIFSPSNGEKRMRKFIKRYARTIPGVSLYSDNGNLYITRGESDTYPCVVAHMDQVQHHSHSKDFDCIIHNDIIMGYSDSQMEQQGLGADDKNGIFVALECLARYDVFKCAFFWGEEIGCCGSSCADMRFFDNVRFVVQCDRKNGGDFVTSIWDSMASDEFISDCCMLKFGYVESDGAMTDVAQLRENGLEVSCINMSCGYYHPHTDHEVTRLSELENCLHFVQYIIENCTKVYTYTAINSMNNEYEDECGCVYYDLCNDIDTLLCEDPTLTVDDIINNYGNELPVNSRFIVEYAYDAVRRTRQHDVFTEFEEAI